MTHVHTIEVMPYWAVDRSALFEAAAQAALRRRSFSWLLLWIPDGTSGHFTRPQIAQFIHARMALDDLQAEATELGLGPLVAPKLGEDMALKPFAEPRRQVMDPHAADELYAALGRDDGQF